jgi:hypothetical protein
MKQIIRELKRQAAGEKLEPEQLKGLIRAIGKRSRASGRRETVHHACMLTVGNHGTNKLIENQNGVTHAKVLQMGVQMPIQMPIQIPQPQPAPQPIPQPQPASPVSPPHRSSPLGKRVQDLLQKVAEFVRSKRTPA